MSARSKVKLYHPMPLSSCASSGGCKEQGGISQHTILNSAEFHRGRSTCGSSPGCDQMKMSKDGMGYRRRSRGTGLHTMCRQYHPLFPAQEKIGCRIPGV